MDQSKRRSGALTVGAAVLLAIAGTVVAAPATESGKSEQPLVLSTTANSLSVMSYNVEGLPPPARFGRAASLERIGERLAALRQEQRQPNVVLLQEAFAAPARAIAGQAGYRYVASGPSADAVNSTPPPPNAAPFAAAASHWKGEDDGKWADSGLRILSDYPIVKVQRIAFPQWACAGYDCLANKGVVIAWIAVPGTAQPVAFIDTHLNSRAASGVAKERADEAYAYQVALLRQFIGRNVPPGSAAFLGGDFNSGKASVRRAEIDAGLLARGRNTLLDALADARAIPEEERGDSQAILNRAKDWLFYRGGTHSEVALTGFEVPFGKRSGDMLSDHMGYEAHYNLGSPLKS